MSDNNNEVINGTVVDGAGEEKVRKEEFSISGDKICLLYTSPSPRD